MKAEDFKTIRYRMGCTQDLFSVLLEVSVGTVSRWENGKKNPDPFYSSMLGALFCILQAKSDSETRVFADDLFGLWQEMGSSGVYRRIWEEYWVVLDEIFSERHKRSGGDV